MKKFWLIIVLLSINPFQTVHGSKFFTTSEMENFYTDVVKNISDMSDQLDQEQKDLEKAKKNKDEKGIQKHNNNIEELKIMFECYILYVDKALAYRLKLQIRSSPSNIVDNLNKFSKFDMEIKLPLSSKVIQGEGNG